MGRGPHEFAEGEHPSRALGAFRGVMFRDFSSPFSRCVLGFSLSLAGHGTHAVFEAIRHALLAQSGPSLETATHPDVCRAWAIMKELRRGLPQEWMESAQPIVPES
uniref:Uncharacterized protein n=1 Tax=Ralstonia syzygii R24 TaxID=907261 RepID=G3A327_9RALS|nr:hypothetical protein RALSY_30001 [Ralstonia syzygii R24]